uniref:Protein X n=1 Tax=Hepatitis B virus TaxID=10407 RepID=A0A075DAN4_HBV|nr:X protein [Hepatitis B virus]
MVARVCCQVDHWRDVGSLRAVGPESRGRPVSPPWGRLRSPCSFAVPADHGAHGRTRGLPVRPLASAGLPALRLTSAPCMETTVKTPRAPPQAPRKRTSGLLAGSKSCRQAYFQASKIKEWEELGEEIRLRICVLGGCRHKLVCSPAPCNFFTSA